LDLISRITSRLFGQPILNNVVRGEVVEEMCLMALEPAWRHAGGDYGAWDLEHPKTGLRIQIKQSAARQSWGNSISSPTFSIAHKTGRYDGAKWISERSRNADIFIFGWHPLTDDTADHRIADQWQFFVVPEHKLPSQKSIRLTNIQRLAAPCSWLELGDSVDKAILGKGKF
jgi:hypothetical protein